MESILRKVNPLPVNHAMHTVNPVWISLFCTAHGGTPSVRIGRSEPILLQRDSYTLEAYRPTDTKKDMFLHVLDEVTLSSYTGGWLET